MKIRVIDFLINNRRSQNNSSLICLAFVNNDDVYIYTNFILKIVIYCFRVIILYRGAKKLNFLSSLKHFTLTHVFISFMALNFEPRSTFLRLQNENV